MCVLKSLFKSLLYSTYQYYSISRECDDCNYERDAGKNVVTIGNPLCRTVISDTYSLPHFFSVWFLGGTNVSRRSETL